MNNSLWYLARILMRCSVQVDQEQLFSEEFVLLRAVSYEEAFGKAEAKGKSMSHSYDNEAGDDVLWSFQSVLEVNQLLDEEIADGCEIYARTCSVPPEVVPREPLAE